jgi:lysophospholipase L1-like esterase
MRILVFWDSITEGRSDTKKWWWVERLKIPFYKKYNIRVSNLWIDGDTSGDILKRFKLTKNSYIRNYNDECIIIFAFWINDACLDWWKNRTPLHIFSRNISQLLKQALDDPLVKHVLILSTTSVNEEKTCPVTWRNIYYKNNIIRQYNSYLEKYADQGNISYIDIFSILNKKNLYDGLHPNKKGHKKIYRLIKKYLEKNIINT